MSCPSCGSEVKQVMIDANYKSQTLARYQCVSADCSVSFQVLLNAKRPEESSGGGRAGPVDFRSILPTIIPCSRCRSEPACIVVVDENTNAVKRLCLTCKLYVYGASQ